MQLQIHCGYSIHPVRLAQVIDVNLCDALQGLVKQEPLACPCVEGMRNGVIESQVLGIPLNPGKDDFEVLNLGFDDGQSLEQVLQFPEGLEKDLELMIHLQGEGPD